MSGHREPKSPFRYTREKVPDSKIETNPTRGGDWASGILLCIDFIGFSYIKLGRARANRG